MEELFSGYDIILASRSPRRRELMDGAGIPYRLADNYHVEEIYPDGLEPARVAPFLSKLKSGAYPHRLTENQILITADTVVILDDQVLGKPACPEEARAMILRLSGRRHTVVTGVTLRTGAREETFSSSTDVWFREISPAEAEFYVERYRPLDKAGAYGIQEWIGYVGICRIDGSFYNVMGLPVQMLYVRLKEFTGR